MFRYLLEALCSVIYPERIAWRSDDEWQQVNACLPRTDEFFITGNLTEDVFHKEKKIVRAASFLWYEHGNLTQQLIRRGKFGQAAEPEVLRRLTREAAYEMLESNMLEDVDRIIPVPLHSRRLRERGFNQAEIIAQELSTITGIPLDTTHLYRTRYNAHQVGLGKQDRAKNSQQLFALRYPEDLYRQRILLVDDVITTGNTILSCTKAMYAARGSKVLVFALAKARRTINNQ